MLHLRRKLEDSFRPAQLEILDDGALHIGHAHEGSGHFSIHIVSTAFAAKPPLARHRMIYAALGNLLQTDIHALSIVALAPGESR